MAPAAPPGGARLQAARRGGLARLGRAPRRSALALALLAAASRPVPCGALVDIVHARARTWRVPAGHKRRWVWDGPGLIEVEAVASEPLDFYLVSGSPRAVQDRYRHPAGLSPSCRQCTRFGANVSLMGGPNITVFSVEYGQSRGDGQGRPAKLTLILEMYGVYSCLEDLFSHVLSLCAVLFVCFCAPGAFFFCSRRWWGDGEGGRHGDAWDESWAPQLLLQCRRPDRPSEGFLSWASHAWLYSYPWNPWRGDPLTFPGRCVLLVINIGLTLLASDLYGKLVSDWDEYASEMMGADDVESDSEGGSGSISAIVLISLVATGLQSGLKLLSLAALRGGLACVSVNPRKRMKVLGLLLAALVFCGGVLYPLVHAASAHRCFYLKTIFANFLVSELTRGVPIALGLVCLEYACLRTCGRSTAPGPEVSMSELPDRGESDDVSTNDAGS